MPKKIAHHTGQEPAPSRSVHTRNVSYACTKSFTPVPSMSRSGTLGRSKSTVRPFLLGAEVEPSSTEKEGTTTVAEVRGRVVQLSSFWKNCPLHCSPRCSYDRTTSIGHYQRESQDITIKKSSFKDGVRMLWADKYRPMTLDSFDIHYQEAMHLRQLISRGVCPHMLFQGPPGAGKRGLAAATIRGLFGTSAWKVNTDIRQFEKQVPSNGVRQGDARRIPDLAFDIIRRDVEETLDKKDDPSYRRLVPIASSTHHVEIDLNHVGQLDYEVLTTIMKEILALTEALNDATDEGAQGLSYKILLLLNAHKLSSDAWHFVRRSMDRVDSVKFILCCDGALKWLEEGFAKSSRHIVYVESPSSQEVVKLLKHVALKERLDLPKQLAISIADQADGNIRKALVALEACHAYHYPFVNDQVVHVDWELEIVEIAAEIVYEQTPRRLHEARVKIQQLLVNCITPGLILQRLVEELIKLMDAQLRREVWYWAALYEQQMPAGANAIFKLEEFVARFMSLYKARSRKASQ